MILIMNASQLVPNQQKILLLLCSYRILIQYVIEIVYSGIRLLATPLLATNLQVPGEDFVLIMFAY